MDFPALPGPVRRQGERMSTRDRRRQLLLSTATLLGALTGYGNRAYAACTLDTLPPGTSTYHCSDSAAVNTTTQNINHDDAEVITNLGFGVDTTLAGGNAITITGDGALSYTDDHMSPLTAAVTGLYIKSTGDSGANYGSITVNTGGDISGGARGIYTRNDGSGFIDITTTGDVTGDTSNGIHAVNDDANGTDITVNTGAGTVYGGNNGIYALNKGQGFVEVTANGNVTGNSTGVSGGIGILAQNLDPDSTHVTVTTGPARSTAATGHQRFQAGTGDLTVKRAPARSKAATTASTPAILAKVPSLSPPTATSPATTATASARTTAATAAISR
ncbi:hypothetical protein AUC68_10145 [Methyloceanibacter methanicus]|uniref:Autotransporter domain-containing protein n=1 Tax=Methyloceanibacter methanicus TaxID=1774968 RepID=A0A1E3VWH9_9HYPH|nr:hypothetical protein [Methyloceanibacter methanicus]ODR97890.1 hypothetical protein AUC68_10145 [Methyloceanibacter methanicus]